jgi:hypothetical protein
MNWSSLFGKKETTEMPALRPADHMLMLRFRDVSDEDLQWLAKNISPLTHPEIREEVRRRKASDNCKIGALKNAT